MWRRSLLIGRIASNKASGSKIFVRFASNESDDEKGLQSFVSRFVSKDFANQDDLSEPDNDPALEFYSEIDSSDPDDLLAYKYRLKPDVNLDQYSPSQIVDSAPDSQDENPFLDSDDELLEVRSKQPEKPTQRVSSISDRIFQKRKVPKHLQNSIVGKETMFWIEILQRGRSIASSIGIDPRLASKEMIDGLSMAEWFGFTDKYLKESGELQFPELIPGFDTTAWTREQKISADPRFNKPSGRTVENTFPEIKQILLNTARNIKTTRDPQQINASLTALYRSFGNPTNAPVPNKSNLFRVKPVGNSEEYLSKLLQRFDSEEMQQVTEKKLYEHPPANLSQQGVADFLEDAIAELTLETLEDTYETIPRYNLPEQYRAPNLGQEVEDMLNSSDSDKPSYLKSEPKLTGPPPRGKCKVCRGMKLEPMNGPLLMQLVDDCGLVLPRRQTNLCPKHQRKVAPTMARAIAMGVFSWKNGPLRYLDPFNPPLDDEEIIAPSSIQKGV